MSQELPIAKDWFDIDPEDEHGVRRVREIHVHDSGGGNMWLVEGRDRCLMVDTGLGVAPLRKFIETITRKPIIAFASVGYYDHAGGLHQFQERLIHKADAHRISQPNRHNTVAQRYMDSAFTARPYQSFDPTTYVMPACEPTRLLAEGDSIELGNRVFEVLHLPGITAGTSALFERASGILFTGEALVFRNDYIYDGEPANTCNDADRSAFRNSINRLISLPASVVYPGHYIRSNVSAMRAIVVNYLQQTNQLSI